MKNLKKDFPVLNKGKKRLIYLDSAATSLTPEPVIAKITSYYRNYSANVHRGIYELSERASDEYEKARTKVADFVGAGPHEIIFVRNATEAINLVAHTWGMQNIKKGDEIITSVMEHHSNLVPWQVLAKEKRAKLKFLDIDSQGQIKMGQLAKLLTKKTKLIAITHVSNTLGTINPIKKITKIAHKHNVPVLVDGAQSVPHMKVDVGDLGCDFFAFSGHKMAGPTGIGVLWMKAELAKKTKSFLTGGGMIRSVTLHQASHDILPNKFEAGTPHIAGAIGLGAAVDYLDKIGMDKVRKHELEIVKYALDQLTKIDNFEFYGPKDASKRGGVIAFNLKGIHPHDVTSILDEEGIAVRAGHHCTMPLHACLKVNASVRASFYIYNEKSDVDRLVKALGKVNKILG